MKETVLVFNVNDSSTKLNIELALFPFHVRLKKVLLADYNKTLGSLVGISDSADPGQSYTGDELESSMMIFAGIPDNKLNLLLKSLRDKKVQLPYKAILTPTNSNWTPLECFEELVREHKAMNPEK
ncbi:DUF3783 domain-containing protein [Novisyntrophococcus fermenticellae]|uniref:DUF3783 domain-containing protein n=1 Tax=Novisyntrophococcus fermenticellae TaxID=2068655 RepID=UPI001E3193B4|nr:DUF3783 domain-containing protein [Novisyntrophococcus fermenticellae]